MAAKWQVYPDAETGAAFGIDEFCRGTARQQECGPGDAEETARKDGVFEAACSHLQTNAKAHQAEAFLYPAAAGPPGGR